MARVITPAAPARAAPTGLLLPRCCCWRPPRRGPTTACTASVLNDDASALTGRWWAAAAHPGQVVEVYDGKEGPGFEVLDALVQDAEMWSAAFCRGGCTLVGHSQAA